MPLYTFRCETCGVKSETRTTISDRDLPGVCQNNECLGITFRMIDKPGLVWAPTSKTGWK